MNKEELLQELSAKVGAGEISREEILLQLDCTLPQKQPTADEHKKRGSDFSATKILYILGAVIVIVGIVNLVSEIWRDIGTPTRIAVTLGLGVFFAAIGSMLLKQKPEENLGALFHALGGILIPCGAIVTLNELKVEPVSLWPVTLTFGAIFAFYLFLVAAHKHPLLTFFAIANGTAFIYLLVEAIVEGSWYQHKDLYAYLTMVVGACYLLLAHGFRDPWNKRLISALHFFGSLGFLGAAFSQVSDSVLWQGFYFVIVIGGLFLSAFMKSRSILVMSTLFLIAHIGYITNKYFAHSLGWPVSLVLFGFACISLGYASITINKRYIGMRPTE